MHWKHTAKAYKVTKYTLLTIALLAPLVATAASPQWRTLAPGLQYTSLPSEKIHAFRIDLKAYQLSLISATHKKQPPFFIKPIAIKTKALIVINGGFFSPTFQPLGLRIHQGNVLHQLKNISWWGIFSIQNNKAQITSKNNYRYTSRITFALQAGPRLLVKGKIPPLKGGAAERSALGITKKGRLIVAISKDQLTTSQFANRLKNALGCYNALNLDGGSSSQLYAHIGDFSLYLPSLRPVADVIAVTKR